MRPFRDKKLDIGQMRYKILGTYWTKVLYFEGACVVVKTRQRAYFVSTANIDLKTAC